MSNTSKGKGVKGSKFWLQTIVNSQLQAELNSQIGDIRWLSPLAEQDDYSEYELKQDYICRELGITEDQKEKIFSFWPSRQPQWDGIALSKDKHTLYLVEAKAHLSELDSKLSACSEDSKNLIMESMEEVFLKHYSNGRFELWMNKYYQLGNRLTFLNKLNDMSDATQLTVKLVLLNFVGDYTCKPTTEQKWRSHYRKVFNEMTGNDNAPDHIMILYFPVMHHRMTINPKPEN